LTNVAFVSSFLSGAVDECVTILESSGRIPEAAIFALTYKPERVDKLVASWREDFISIASPMETPELFVKFKNLSVDKDGIANLETVMTGSNSVQNDNHDDDEEET